MPGGHAVDVAEYLIVVDIALGAAGLGVGRQPVALAGLDVGLPVAGEEKQHFGKASQTSGLYGVHSGRGYACRYPFG